MNYCPGIIAMKKLKRAEDGCGALWNIKCY